ncbi:hydroxyacylglutathione hydrolase [Legionella sp. km772]|uniref:hydroxyacylglutathione hydrolase n=1 Tax=Legionella sp. km772 TaxID=2498111 RepID=UPI000F8E48B8|nr:hydroxyacylglutathione hydrolase [Legionella sp. km772]RUR07497.1 hydroxyacylglutathione hydrolase [Legionella sp. km772]
MTIVPISAFSDNYIWSLINRSKSLFSCVDPGEAYPVLSFAKEHSLTLQSIFITHHHHDHIGGLEKLVEHYPACTVYGPLDSRIPFITNPVKKDQILELGDYSFRILSNPGHTSTHISYFEPNQHWLFCGDTLFSAGCGKVFDGTLEQLYESLLLFKTLPQTTKIFCAHEYTQQNLSFAQTVEPSNAEVVKFLSHLKNDSITCSLPSTLAHELLINPFLRLAEPEVQKYAYRHGAQSNAPQEIFSILREQKNQFR